ncbi:hypothetical protein WJX81_003281 [Elliptochloris bilobata]|uniref:SBP-type domain-containing protein n=1 Tax=Elliptochloris bilobata TaxID=381761 RepID=A0AAW1RCE6_9CHLO
MAVGSSSPAPERTLGCELQRRQSGAVCCGPVQDLPQGRIDHAERHGMPHAREPVADRACSSGHLLDKGDRKGTSDRRHARKRSGGSGEEEAAVDGRTLSDAVGSGAAVSVPLRRRVRAAASKRMCCQVAGCERALNTLSTYHQRCRICDRHIKLASFEHRGRQQRFCQQCGRCHELVCFEGVKHACRAQLAKHNARRRRNSDAAVAERGEEADASPASAADAGPMLCGGVPAALSDGGADAAGGPGDDPMSAGVQAHVSSLDLARAVMGPPQAAAAARDVAVAALPPRAGALARYRAAPAPLLEAPVPRVALACGSGALVELRGTGLLAPDSTVLARAGGAYVSVQADRIGEDRVRVRLPAGQPPGLIWLEVERGAQLSAPQPLLLLPEGCLALAAELVALLAEGSAAGASGWQGGTGLLADLGLVLRAHTGRGATADARNAPAADSVMRTARRLLAFACDAAAPKLAQYLLREAAGPSGSTAGAVDDINGATQGDGLTLLHRAVRSGSAGMVDLLLDFGHRQGFCWRADVRGVGGLTPMHLAALSPEFPALSRLLAGKCAPGPAAWFFAATDDGLTPAAFAERAGCPERNVHMLQRAITAGQGPGRAEDALAAQCPPGKRCCQRAALNA